jgi:hypothetical protein
MSLLRTVLSLVSLTCCPNQLSWWTIARGAVAILRNSGYDRRVPRLTSTA